jgi:membrane dipeptidase
LNTDKLFIFDAHLDLSMNAMEWNRDLRLPVRELRAREEGKTDLPDRGKGTVSFPELAEGNVGVVVATQIARYVKPGSKLPGWNSQEQAWAQTQGQLEWYKAMEQQGYLSMITDRITLDAHLKAWENHASGMKSIGYILSLEGADSLIDMSYLERAYEAGLRALGPAHYGPGVYAFGTDSTGGLGVKGRELIQKMDELGIILDVTHLCDESFWEAVDLFKGALWASHNNCRALVNHNRQFSDEQIRLIIDRGGVIGAAFDAWMLYPDWIRGRTTPQSAGVTLETVVDHIDHICQLAGNANHVGLGTDLDGAFGKEQCPHDLETIADLQKLPEIFRKRGYIESDIQKILSGNWIEFLRRVWG